MIDETKQEKNKSVIDDMAEKFGMDRKAFELTVRKTVMPSKVHVSNEEFVAFLLVAKEYDLNPFIKEIFAFPAKGGGIATVVSIDGWIKMINQHPKMDGMTLQENFDSNKNIQSITCTIFRKDRNHPIVITEYLKECIRGTDPWKAKPIRMLRHKATIQCGRYAFGISGIMDEDEYGGMQEGIKDITPRHNNDIEKDFIEPTEDVKKLNQSALASIMDTPQKVREGLVEKGAAKSPIADGPKVEVVGSPPTPPAVKEASQSALNRAKSFINVAEDVEDPGQLQMMLKQVDIEELIGELTKQALGTTANKLKEIKKRSEGT